MDFRGPDFHEPTPNMLSYLKEVGLLLLKLTLLFFFFVFGLIVSVLDQNGKVISREMHETLLAKEKTEQLEVKMTNLVD